jgi:hypothetical protein
MRGWGHRGGRFDCDVVAFVELDDPAMGDGFGIGEDVGEIGPGPVGFLTLPAGAAHVGPAVVL